MDKKIYTKVHNGKIKVLDPNKLEDENGLVEDRYVSADELVMYLNIKARINPRSRILNSDGKDKLVDLATIKSVNFLKPVGKDGFTTDWTEMFGQSDVSTDLEGFGVQNVNIKMNANMLPEIDMEFVDVRGQNLFAKGDQPDSPYNLFFSFPYPIFFLTIKGYYGKAIQLPLAMVKTNTRFDGDTGNYVTNCEFKSWTFGYYNDFNLSYLFVTPYMYRLDGGDYEGRKYLDNVYARNPIVQSDGSPDPVSTGSHTMIDLINGISSIQESFKSKSPEFVKFKEEYAEYSEINNRLQVLENTVQDIYNSLDIVNDQRIQSSDEIYNNIEEQIDELRSNTKFIELLKQSKITDNKNSKFINPQIFIVNAVLGTVTLDEFHSRINKVKQSIDGKLKDLQSTINDKIDITVDEILGYSPSIRNIMYIICCNLQAFIDLMVDKSQLALDQCRDAQKNRGSRYNRQKNNGEHDILDSEPRFYPWPEYYKQPLNSNVPPEKITPAVHVENRTWEEVKFVDEILLATTRIYELIGSSTYQSNRAQDLLLNFVSVFDLNQTPQNDYQQLTVDDVVLKASENAQDLLFGGGLGVHKINDAEYTKFMSVLGEYDGTNFIRNMKEQTNNVLDYKVTSVLKNLLKSNGFGNIKDLLLTGVNPSYEDKIVEYSQVFKDGGNILSRDITNYEGGSQKKTLWSLLRSDTRSNELSIYSNEVVNGSLNSEIHEKIPLDNVQSDNISGLYSIPRKSTKLKSEDNIILGMNNANTNQKFFENEQTNLFEYGNVSEEFSYQPNTPSVLDSDLQYNGLFFTNRFTVEDEINPKSFNKILDNE